MHFLRRDIKQCFNQLECILLRNRNVPLADSKYIQLWVIVVRESRKQENMNKG